ncbi:MAG: LysR family transcriptional regulator [Streptosporangiales bacterium]
MEMRQLEYFIAVAEEASFTRAAERVHISQSGVSAQIRQLEHDLGAALLDRSGRETTLTAAGSAAIAPARAVLAAAGAVRQAVDEVNGLLRGRLVIGMVTACTVTPLFEALAAFHQSHPGVEISLLEGNSDVLTAQVRAGLADLALIGSAGAPPDDLEALTIISEPLAAAVPPGPPLAGRGRVTLADLAGYPIVSLPEGTGVRAVFDQSCLASGVRPDIALQASAPGSVADLAVRGLGVAILSQSMAAGHAGRLRAVAIDGLAMPAVLALVWAPDPGPALRELLAHTRETFGPAR